MQSIAPKTPRGIQEADVWAAADALLADGHKPTIEKVRQHMGRGSPNTVAPMLDAWFSTLGARLGLNQQTQELRNSVPTPVLEMAQMLWSNALEHAHEVATQTLQAREQAAADTQVQLEALQNKLQQKQEGLQQQQQAMDAALKLAQAQREDLSRRLDEMQQQMAERDALLEKQRLDSIAQRQAQEAMREQHSRELESATHERHRLAEQYAGNERRMLAEVDRSRQEVEKSKKLQLEAERASAQRYEELQARHLQTEEELLTARGAHIHQQQALSMAQERIAELKALLERSAQQPAALQLPASGSSNSEKSRSMRSLQSRALAQRSQRLPRK